MLVIQIVKESANQMEDHLGVVAVTVVVIQDVLVPVIALVQVVVAEVDVAVAVEDAMAIATNHVVVIVTKHAKARVGLNQQMVVVAIVMDPVVPPAPLHVLLSATHQ